MTLVEVYSNWAGICSPMADILVKIKVDLQVKHGEMKLNEKLQFSSACSNTIQVGGSPGCNIAQHFTFYMSRHWKDSKKLVNQSGSL